MKLQSTRSARTVRVILTTLAICAFPSARADEEPPTKNDAIKKAIKDLNGHLPSQSHTMMDVAYHFGNLWFAGRAENWPLARFCTDETLSHLRWAVRVKPVRPLAAGGELHLAEMLGAIETSTFKELKGSVEAENVGRFQKAYGAMMTNCYACHVAAEKPYLRLQIPKEAPEKMIDFDLK